MIDNEIFRKGIREDGTVEGYLVETHYLPCTAIGDDAAGFLRVVIDDNATDVETRVPHSALIAAGWAKTPAGAHGRSFDKLLDIVTQELIEAPDEQFTAGMREALPLTDERLDEMAESQTWYDGDCPRLDHRRFARDVLAAAGMSVDGGQP